MIPQRTILKPLDPPSSPTEVTKVIKQTFLGKAPGVDGITASWIYKNGELYVEQGELFLKSSWVL